jgi:hypothetical protein
MAAPRVKKSRLKTFFVSPDFIISSIEQSSSFYKYFSSPDLSLVNEQTA